MSNNIWKNPAGNLSLSISEDKLSAWLTVHASGQLINEQDILDLIDAAGIKYGFEDALRHIRRHSLEKEFDQPFPLAMCKAGHKNAPIKHFFDLEAARAFSPNVSPQDIEGLTCVEAGTVLADVSDNIFSREGSIYNVLGEMIIPQDADEEGARALAGENVKFLMEKGQYVSTKAGYIGVDPDGRISIHNSLVITSDLEQISQLRTPVDLVIQGSVRSCFLAVQGNLSIEGEIRESGINCGGDLLVGAGIVSCRHGGLEVMGNLKCGEILRSKVLCRGELQCSQISSSEVVGERGVFVQGGIIHSNVQSAVRIEASFAGEPEEGSSVTLEITISPFLKDLLMQLTRELVRAKQDGNQEDITSLSDRISQCETELDRELNGFLTRDKHAPAGIKIHQDLYPTVQARVLKHEYQIRQHRTGLEIEEKN